MRGGRRQHHAIGAHDGGEHDQDAAGARHRLRSSKSRTIAARSSGMPSPLREDVTSTSGNAAGCFASAAIVSAMRACELRGLHLVGLGQHDLIAHRRFIQRLQHVLVDVLQAMAAVDQHIDAREAGASQQEFVDQRGPGRDLRLGRGGVAVAGHVDQPQAVLVRPFEEDQFLGAARRVRGARQRVAAGQRVDQAGLADIGAAGKGDLQPRHRRQRLDRGRGPDELPVAGEQLSALLRSASHRCRRSCEGFRLPTRHGEEAPCSAVSNHEAQSSDAAILRDARETRAPQDEGLSASIPSSRRPSSARRWP